MIIGFCNVFATNTARAPRACSQIVLVPPAPSIDSAYYDEY